MHACCGGVLCFENVCAADCTDDASCVSGCCVSLSSGRVCAPEDLCRSPNMGMVPGIPPAAGDVIESQIDGEFNGWTGETLFPLLNGQVWQQVAYAYHYHYAYSPRVLIVRSGSQHEMHVDGVDPAVTVALADVLVDSRIIGDFNGWNGDTLFELANGQIWQQVGPGIETHVAVRPRALIFRAGVGARMYVEGIDSTVQVQQLR